MENFDSAASGRTDPEYLSGDRPPHPSVEAAIEAAMNAGSGESVRTGDVLDELATRSLGPLLFFPALIGVLPGIGALPGVTWTMAALIMLISFQMMFTHNSHWAPRFLRRLKLKRDLLRTSISWTRRPARWIDRVTAARLRMLLRGPFAKLIGLSVFLLSAAMFVASIVPGAVVIPGLVVLVFSVALITQDGVVALLGHALTLAAGGFVWWAVT